MRQGLKRIKVNIYLKVINHWDKILRKTINDYNKNILWTIIILEYYNL